MFNPVIVCGLARSGTTLIGALLSYSPDVEVLLEPPSPSRVPAFLELLQQFRSWCQEMSDDPHEAWRQIDRAFVDEGSYRLFTVLCRVCKPPRNAADGLSGLPLRTNDPLLCLKKPEAELQAEVYESILASRPPRYIYCLRSPAQVYASILSVAWGATVDPQSFLHKLADSVGALRRLATSTAIGRVRVFNVERASQSHDYRRQATSALFDFLGVEMTDGARRFVEQWPPVNRRFQVYRDRCHLDAEEQRARISSMLSLLTQDRELQSAVEELLAV